MNKTTTMSSRLVFHWNWLSRSFDLTFSYALVVLFVALSVAGCSGTERQRGGAAASTTTKTRTIFGFDSDNVGRVPSGWRVESTGKETAVVAQWGVVADASAPSKPNVLAMTGERPGNEPTFNLCWTDTIGFKHGNLSLKFKAVAGEVDQGGGPVWRIRDANNYYICRANPLEGNFRLYSVVGGTRKQLATAKVEIKSGVWHTIEVEHVGNRIVCTLNGTTRIEATDEALSAAGGVGVWTKADALTSFDDLSITPAKLP